MSRGSTTNSWVRELRNQDDWRMCWVDPIGFPWHDGSMFANYFTIENLPSMDSGKYVLFDPKLFGRDPLSKISRCAVWWHAVVPNRSHGFWRITQRCPLGDPKTWGTLGAATTKNVAGKLLTTTLLPGLVFWIGGLSNFGGSWIILCWIQVMSQKMVMISMCMALTDTKDITQTYWVSLCTWLLAFETYLLGTFY